MEVQKLINQYQIKVIGKDLAIVKIQSMITEARQSKTSTLDLEDLALEKQNAQRDRQLYVQFIKDLEDLN
jgi:hypothetical protein